MLADHHKSTQTSAGRAGTWCRLGEKAARSVVTSQEMRRGGRVLPAQHCSRCEPGQASKQGKRGGQDREERGGDRKGVYGAYKGIPTG